MAKIEHARELLDKLGDVCETQEEAEKLVHTTLAKAEVEILKTLARRLCPRCSEPEKYSAAEFISVGGLWVHKVEGTDAMYMPCSASDTCKLIAEIMENLT